MAGETLCPYRDDLSSGAETRRAAPISDTRQLSLFPSLSPPCASLARSLRPLCEEDGEKGGPIRAIQRRAEGREREREREERADSPLKRIAGELNISLIKLAGIKLDR